MSAPFACEPIIRVQASDFDPAAEAEALTRGRADIGGVATFVGLCRDEGGRLAALEIEHYGAMALEEIGRTAALALARWPLLGLAVIHRFGTIEAGGRIVFVSAAAVHRAAAFEATWFLIDYLKSRAPFWKREHRRDGTRGEWIEPRAQDDEAAARWRAAVDS